MKLKYLVAALFTVAAGTVSAGELIATESYEKPGCSWALVAIHPTGGPYSPGPMYQYNLTCGTEFVAMRVLINNTPHSCSPTSHVNLASFTFIGNLCGAFSISRK